MKSSIKIAFVAAIAVAGIAACTSTPAPQQNAAPATLAPSVTIAPPTSVVTTIVTATVTNPPKPDSLVKADNRLGYGALKLGMTPDEAVAAGLTGVNWKPNATCMEAENVAISTKYGIERITLPADATTSKGIGVGSTVADVKRAYPNAKAFRMGFSASLDDTGSYQFTTYGHAEIVEIVEIKLVSRNVDCAFAAL